MKPPADAMSAVRLLSKSECHWMCLEIFVSKGVEQLACPGIGAGFESVKGEDMAAAKHRRSRLEGTAYHEAGHAVVAWMQGRKIVRLSIKADGHVFGWCASRTARSCTRDDVVFALAGPFAEAQYWGRMEWLTLAGEILQLRARELEKQVTHAFEPAARFTVKFYWPVIQALAAKLFEAGALSGKAAEKIIGEAWRQQQAALTAK